MKTRKSQHHIIKTIIWSTLFFVMVSCGNRPSYILSEKKMIDLMVDMELAEAYSNSQVGSKTSEAKKELGRRVLASHKVTPEQLDTTLAWYGRNLDEYSELFDKIDKEILRRKEKYIVQEIDLTENEDNLWPYSEHITISPLSGSDGFILSLPEPSIEKGEKVKLSFYMPNPAGIKGVWGVEYNDGTSEATISTFNGKSKIEMELQTDTGKTVSRLYGVMNLKEKIRTPIYIDSIFIAKHALDSLEYRQKRRSLKTYGAIQANPKSILSISNPDSIPSDSISKEHVSNLKDLNKAQVSDDAQKDNQTKNKTLLHNPNSRQSKVTRNDISKKINDLEKKKE